jgi:alkaline phosphatase D
LRDTFNPYSNCQQVKRRSLLKTIAALPAIPRTYAAGEYRTWLGPEFWANPLQDWRKSGDRIECHVAGGDRNVSWLVKEIAPKPQSFTMTVRLGRLAGGSGQDGEGWVGFRTGMRGHFSDYRDTAIRGLGVESGITADGRLFIGKTGNGPAVSSLDDVVLKLEGKGNTLRLSAGGQSIEETVPGEWMAGGVALVCHSGEPPHALPRFVEPAQANAGKPNQQRGGTMPFWFRDWTLTGPGVAARPERAWGPILFTQYTIAGSVMKMTVQLAPMEGDEQQVELRLEGRRPIAVKPETYSSTAAFRVTNWNATRDVPFNIVFQGQTYPGVIRRDPADQNEIVVGALTCQGDFGFPHSEIARSIQSVKPDILFFTGDQLYEANGGYGIQRGPAEAARLDYLRKWYMFGWAWGELTRNTPCICLPDDHDVYHGNLWGAGGRAAERPSGDLDPQAAQQFGQDSGGYVMPARWVQLVETTQSSHLPDSLDKSPVDQAIGVHYGHLVWGGISFAILEDRKWKSAPKTLMPGARIRNGWPQNPAWNAATQGDVDGAQLLGERQEQFLVNWARDWPDGVEMKAVVSATIFCNLATLPPAMTSDVGTPKLPVQPIGGHAEGERLTQDHDSNGWPQTPRNRALRAMRSCLAVHIAGDQHLASTVQYGIDDWNDGPYGICTPAISNIFPRRWFPPQSGANRKPDAPRYTGEYKDGFGNRITVHAVANPQQFGIAPKALTERAPGFGVVVFDKGARKIRLENYPRWADLSKGGARQYPGWPIIIDQTDNGLNGAKWELRLPQSASGLVRVLEAGSKDPVLMWHTAQLINRVPIWRPGVYSVRIGRRDFGTVKASEAR